MKNVWSICIFILWGINICAENNKTYQITLGGNAYVTEGIPSGRRQGVRIGDDGVSRWSNPETVISTYFYLDTPGVYPLFIRAKGHSVIQVVCNGKKFKVKIDSDTLTDISVGKIKIKNPGYVKVDMQGLEKKDDTYAEVSDFIIHDIKGKIVSVKDFSFYWGRRGPSVHLGYTMPEQDVEWFYNEVTVPEDGEVMNSYYMANGFGEGYFGIQYNSPQERRVLFSVWSPFETEDPNLIPEEDKIRMLRRGEDVHIGEFGNEGSGGQSYLKYNWKAGVTYKFLTQIKPDGKGNTVYTAYFYATDENRWRLIASFMRPKTNTWYKGAHSFLENFSPNQGYLTRRVLFGNQWIMNANGVWKELTEARFTYDGTANAGVRLDYQGGLTTDKKYFYLKNCGFFNENTPLHEKFERTVTGQPPVIDFEALEKL